MISFASHFLFPGHMPPIAKGIVEVDDSGRILKIIDPENKLYEKAGMEFHNGVICPTLIPIFDYLTEDEFFLSFPELSSFKDNLEEYSKDERGVFEWMKQIQLEDSSFSLEKLIQIFTLKSSELINKQDELGSIEKGKTPGLSLISQMDYRSLKLNENSRIKKLI